MTSVYALYQHRPDLGADMWDLCGVYATQADALEAMHRLLGGGLVADDFAIDVLTLGEALGD